MLRKIGLWVLAFVITVLSAAYQKKTGPTYPLSGQSQLAGQTISYTLLRSHDTGDQPVDINVNTADVKGVLVYRRYKSNDDWTRVEMVREQNRLKSYLPHQPPAGKLEYHIELSQANASARLPEAGEVITRFKGPVPLAVLLPHILFMFAAMLVSTRTALAALAGSKNLRQYALWTVGLLLVGGMVLGPLVQKYAFGAYWTGFPFGYDLTDNKTLIAFLAWCVALWATYKKSDARAWVLAAGVITLVVFMIPHSLMGSELKHDQMVVKP
jgi:hypothetical protein